jgi:hypothetical protein
VFIIKYAFGILESPSDYFVVVGLGGLCALSLKGNVKKWWVSKPRNPTCKKRVHPNTVGATATSFQMLISLLFAKNFPNPHYLKMHLLYLGSKKFKSM